MNAVLRQALVVLVVTPFAVSLLGLRCGCNSTDLRKIIQAARRNEELEQSRGPTFHRIGARVETVRELLTHRCSLSQALAHFEELDGEHPDELMELSRKGSGNGSDTERNYQYIVEIAKDLLADHLEEATAVLRRLEKEYQQFGADRQKSSAMLAKRTELSR
jgi:hypothetical protein